MQGSGATELATKVQCTPDTAIVAGTLKPKEEVDDSVPMDMKIRCPCGSSLFTESMIKVCSSCFIVNSISITFLFGARILSFSNFLMLSLPYPCVTHTLI